MTKEKTNLKPTTEAVKLSELLAAKRDAIVNNIMEQREEILNAFIAETGLKPSECEQVIETDGMLIRWYIRKRS